MKPLTTIAALTASLITLSTTFSAYADEEVNVYSYRQPFLIKPLFAAFTRETGIDVNVVFAKKGLVERVKNEGRNSPVDLIFTVDIGRLSDAKEAGVTQATDSSILDSNIPAQYRDPERHWFGLTLRARALVVSKERVPAGAIKAYEDLADPQWAGKVCSRSGKHVYNVALTAAMISHHGEQKAEQWLTGFRNNLARKPQGNDRAQVKAVKAGECDIAIINHYYMGKMLANEEQFEWADAVNLIFPNQEDRGTHVNISGMALTQYAPNKANAIKLMEFLSSDLAQQMYAEQNYEYPVKKDTTWSGLLKSFGEFKADTLSLDTIAEHRKAAIMLTDKVAFDSES